tara:strand:- start:710 stop:2119 length:1410 start_codon:yes stop_codon:yes gene_type:complete
MSETKSKGYEVSISVAGSKVAYRFDENNNIVGVDEIRADGSIKPIEPGTTDYATAIASDTALYAYNVNKYEGKTESYLAESQLDDNRENIQSNLEQRNLSFTKADKSFRNQAFISSGGTSSIAQYTSNKNVTSSGTYIDHDETAGTYGKMNKTEKSSEIFAYPLDIDPRQDHMKIVRYEYLRADINLSKGRRTEFFSNIDPSKRQQNVAGDSVIGSNPMGSILLPMPKVTDVNGVEWGKSELNINGLTALGSVDNLTGIAGNFLRADGINQAQATRQDAAKDAQGRGTQKDGLMTLGQTMGTNISLKTASFLMGTDIDMDTYLARTGGKVLNPNAEMLFQGPTIRSFPFSFLMVARSQREGQEIRKIIRFLKLGMAPKFRNTTYLANPDIFTLHYKNGPGKNDELDTVNKFNPGGLALTNMNVDYAPNGYWSAYRDSHPVALRMDLEFTELRPIYYQDQEATPESSVGL